MVLTHKNRRLDGITDTQHFGEGLDRNYLVAVTVKFTVDPLDIRAVGTEDLADLCGVRNIVVNSKLEEYCKTKRLKCRNTCKYASHDHEYILVYGVLIFKHLDLVCRRAGGGINIKGINRHRDIQRRRILILALGLVLLTHAEHLNVESNDKSTAGFIQIVGINKLGCDVIILVVIDKNAITDLYARGILGSGLRYGNKIFLNNVIRGTRILACNEKL